MPSSVYLVPHAVEGRFKVGYSSNPGTRFINLGAFALNIEEAVVFNVSSSSAARALEADLHRALCSHNVKNCTDGQEWFYISAWSDARNLARSLGTRYRSAEVAVSRRNSGVSRSGQGGVVSPRLKKTDSGVVVRRSPFDEAAAWDKQLRERRYEGQQDLARALGISLPEVSKTLSLLGMPQSLQDVLRTEPACESLAQLYLVRNVCKRAGLTIASDLASRIKSERLSYRQTELEAKELMAQVAAIRRRRTLPSRDPVKPELVDGEWRVVLGPAYQTREEAQALAAKIEKILACR